MYPTISDVLTMPVVQHGDPRVVAGSASLQRPVRWVHAAELAEIAHLLTGGELVLTTGIALPEGAEGLTRYIDDLAHVGAAGVVVELVHRWPDRLPACLVAAAERRELPLITLSRETRFVSVAEAVAGLIVQAQIGELQAAENIHETFTDLTMSGADPTEILHEVARSSGLPAILENLAHHVLAYDAADQDPLELLADWDERSRRTPVTDRTFYDESAGWLVTMVGARGDVWGRLVLPTSDPPPRRHMVVAERAASALALHRLTVRDRESLDRQAHRTLLSKLIRNSESASNLVARAAGLGVPLMDRQLVGIAVRPRLITGAAAHDAQELLRDLAEATARASRVVSVPALVGMLDEKEVRALLSLPPQTDRHSTLQRLAPAVHRAASGLPRPTPVVLATGTPATTLNDVRRSLAEATHVAAAALRSPDAPPYHCLEDVRLRGLLHLLRDDERVAAFVERELGALADNPRLLQLLRGYCQYGGNKSTAAAAAHLSRNAYYRNITRIEQLLGVSLDEPESLLSLHVALLAREISQPDNP